MTDGRAEIEPQWLPVLRAITRASGHELRNALNAMVMNLEVVRTRSGALDSDTAPFLVQAIEQAEESAGLAESAIALLQMVVGAIGEDGVVSARYVPPSSVAIDGGESDAARAAGRLSALSSRSSLSADVSGGTVILSIAEEAQDPN